MSFHIDSPRAGGKYEFHLPAFLPADSTLPEYNGEYDPVTGEADDVAKRYHHEICRQMSRILRQPAKPFRVLLSREIYEDQGNVYEIVPSAVKRIASSLKTDEVKNMLTTKNRALFLEKHALKYRKPEPGAGGWYTICEGHTRAMAASCSKNFRDVVQAAEWLEKKGRINLENYGTKISMKFRK